MPETQTNHSLYLLVGLLAVFFFILLLYGIMSFLADFSRELRYLNCEINRTVGEERRRWIRKRRRLWLSIIPFVKY